MIRGNVLVIPIEDSLLYVEPIYLQAETAAYPELRLVVLMHGDNLSYAENFEQALQGLFKEREERITPLEEAGPVMEDTLAGLIKRASDAFENYLNTYEKSGSARPPNPLKPFRNPCGSYRNGAVCRHPGKDRERPVTGTVPVSWTESPIEKQWLSAPSYGNRYLLK